MKNVRKVKVGVQIEFSDSETATKVWETKKMKIDSREYAITAYNSIIHEKEPNIF